MIAQLHRAFGDEERAEQQFNRGITLRTKQHLRRPLLPRRLTALKTRLNRVLYYTDLFGPYTNLDCRFGIKHTLEMYEITTLEHSHFTLPALDFRGSPTGIDIRKVVELGIPPRVNTGIAHKDAGVGQVGAGLVRPPMKIFEQALLAYAEKHELVERGWA